MVPRTPLENWIRAKVCAPGDARPLTRPLLEAYQLRKIQETLAAARSRSPFYRRHLAGLDDFPVKKLHDLAGIPFTTAEDIRQSPLRFLAVSQDAIRRIVTLQTSATTGAPKRIFFTADDLEDTIDFFHRGMSTLVKPGQRVLILLPGDRPDAVGDLLCRALARMQTKGIAHGPVVDPERTLKIMAAEKVDCLVGIPTQVLTLARWRDPANRPAIRIKSVLLTTDYVPAAVVKAIEAAWNCRVFSHYGMTEMGWGGGVECRARQGHHLREADLYCEIVDPESGRPLPEGASGEVVFTTLNRRGMPLVRYRTGDVARFLPDACPCGTVLKRLGPVCRRLDSAARIGPGCELTMARLDEALFSIPGIIDFSAELTGGKAPIQLEIIFRLAPGADPADVMGSAETHLTALSEIATAGDRADLRIGLREAPADGRPIGWGAKRTIKDRRENATRARQPV